MSKWPRPVVPDQVDNWVSSSIVGAFTERVTSSAGAIRLRRCESPERTRMYVRYCITMLHKVTSVRALRAVGAVLMQSDWCKAWWYGRSSLQGKRLCITYVYYTVSRGLMHTFGDMHAQPGLKLNRWHREGLRTWLIKPGWGSYLHS